MIVIDIETSGVDPAQHGILSIGAVDFETGDEFYGECRLDFGLGWTDEALKINGFTVEQILDSSKQHSSELLFQFREWSKPRSSMLAGQNIGSFDLQFLLACHKNHNSPDTWIFRYHTVDLHSVAFAKFKKSYSLPKICKLLNVEPEPEIHNALTGARTVAECLKRLLND